MINEFVKLNEALKFAQLSLETLPAGMFVKLGKRLEKKVVLYWVMVPLELVMEDIGEVDVQDGDK